MILLDLLRVMNACRYSPFWHYLLVFTLSINLNLTLNSLLVTRQMTLSIYWKHWRSLEQRRVDSRLTNLYKLRNHLFAMDENKYLQRGTGRRDHQYDYRQLRADKDYTRFSFFPRTVIQWSQLSRQNCLAELLDTFKNQVAKIEHSRLN